ncbi:toll/interleukin-1 receptor domain-containing protein [Rubrivivax gelatinosus]|uniref:toll/interleukin-1 receptor domain-containing protein n=1 Tax=Rubrivivax gelatinosus TaxID=28068 RepID=UPI001E2C0939|nr:toll/interleukin-1 receptor domain-containing protein [Rubrivivax gelatinosus]
MVYVAWHPDFPDGAGIAEAIRGHFRRELYENVAGGAGLSVVFRSLPPPGRAVPLEIDFAEAHATAIVILVDSALAADAPWLAYARSLGEQAEATGLQVRTFPVAIEHAVLAPLDMTEQALRWDQWDGDLQTRTKQLLSELTYEYCRMLRHFLEHLRRPEQDEAALEAYLSKVQVFLSHSKHDDAGERVARLIRDRLHAGHGLASFFDVHDIPAGLRFHKVLLQQVRVSAMVAIHTDTYSSREWCRKEVIEAKRYNVPLVVANCISNLDERGFPYMGNVPVVRLDPDGPDRINVVIARLLDEVLKDYLWRCRIALSAATADPAVTFIPRPPELITLAALPPEADVPAPMVVYPDPPLSAEEERLFAEIAPRVQLRSLTEWLSGAVR